MLSQLANVLEIKMRSSKYTIYFVKSMKRLFAWESRL